MIRFLNHMTTCGYQVTRMTCFLYHMTTCGCCVTTMNCYCCNVTTTGWYVISPYFFFICRAKMFLYHLTPRGCYVTRKICCWYLLIIRGCLPEISTCEYTWKQRFLEVLGNALPLNINKLLAILNIAVDIMFPVLNYRMIDIFINDLLTY